MSATATATETTTTLVYESDLGTLKRADADGAFVKLVVRVKAPATSEGFAEMLRLARAHGYSGRLNCIGFYRDGSERWIIHPAI